MTQSTALVNRDGQLLHRDGPALPIYSIAKTFIASAIVHLPIDLNTQVDRWFDTTWLPANTGITIAHLLQHSSGLRDYTSLPAYTQAIQRGDTPWSDEEFAQRTLQQPLLFKPGSQFAYANPGYWLLKRILELELEADWQDIVEQKIATPLGLEDVDVVSGQFAPDLQHYPAGWVWHGVINSPAVAVARFMASARIHPLTHHRIKVPQAQPPWIDPHYGYGIMIEPGVMYGHNGNGPNYAASCFHFIQSGLTGCVITNEGGEEEAMLHLKQMQLKQMQQAHS